MIDDKDRIKCLKTQVALFREALTEIASHDATHLSNDMLRLNVTTVLEELNSELYDLGFEQIPRERLESTVDN
jgi:hypothetical protein